MTLDPESTEVQARVPARWGNYGTAGAYYASDEWLQLVRDSLAHFRVLLARAKRIKQDDAIKFYTKQIAACERELGLNKQPGLFD